MHFIYVSPLRLPDLIPFKHLTTNAKRTPLMVGQEADSLSGSVTILVQSL